MRIGTNKRPAHDSSSEHNQFWRSERWRSGEWIHEAVTQPPLPARSNSNRNHPEENHLFGSVSDEGVHDGPGDDAGTDDLDSFGATEALVFPAPTRNYEPQKNQAPTSPGDAATWMASAGDARHASTARFSSTGVSLAAVAGLVGCIALLYTFTAPLFSSHFVTEDLAPAILPYSSAELDGDARTAVSYDYGATDVPMGASIEEPSIQEPGIQEHRAKQARAMLAEIGAGESVSASDFARLMMAVESTEVPAGLAHRKLGARVALSVMLLLAMAALIAGLMVLARRMAPLDRTQSVVHGAFGALGLTVFGLLLTAILFDSTVATQIEFHGVASGLLGATLLWGSSLSALRTPRDWFINPLLGVGLLGAIGLFIGLLITL